ncbi:ubiquitin carboxyl-terminal hydrolase 32 [Plakobranchus ocellatus]|uniref:ubiquitinyl hydrolase 1 n=1 Tax=Plakobranchus ocellatus TaxID=259542 RepID=A0AAV4AEV9_9GAST|nr:ubiquitin carboxyl-terminal hydrolase 32 [Plakobranchus ocellatus]
MGGGGGTAFNEPALWSVGSPDKGVQAEDGLDVDRLSAQKPNPLSLSLPRDEQKIRTLMVPGSLFLYQLPPPPLIQPMTEEEEESGAGPATTEGSASDQQDGSRESLDLPEVQRLSTLDPTGIPAIVASCEAPPTGPCSPGHSRSPSNVSIANTETSRASDLFENFVIGVHRKINLLDLYFLSSQKSRLSMFGTPIIIPRNDATTNAKLYQFVWTQIARLVSPVPPSELKVANHAQDCDDSLGYEYPFILKEVKKDGLSCAKCPWFRFCRGCKVECNSQLFDRGSSFLAIDWEATALHLRYQTTQEKYFEEHESVAASRQKQTEPIDLDTCLQAFTQWEELDEDQLYYCSKCKAHCLASKKLDIWRLPPILIINLKRFQYLNGRWVKSHKIVNFPLQAFDPSAYLAQRDPSSPTEILPASTKPVLASASNSSDTSYILSSSSSVAPSSMVSHHARLQQVEQYHQQDEQSSGDVSVSSSSSVSTSNSFDSSTNVQASAMAAVTGGGLQHTPQHPSHSAKNSTPSDSIPLSATALIKQSSGRVSTSTLSTSSAGSGSMLGHVTSITVDSSKAKHLGQQAGDTSNTNPAHESAFKPSLSIPSSAACGTSTVARLPHNIAQNYQTMQPNPSLRGQAEPASVADSFLAASVKPQANGSVRAGRDSQAIAARLRGFDTEDYTNVKYNLYAMSCHTGILGGGHYVAYAKNENQRWYVYNDSSCKELPEGQLAKNSAYILFYEREGVDFTRFMPDTTGREPDLSEIDDEIESNFKKNCVLQ